MKYLALCSALLISGVVCAKEAVQSPVDDWISTLPLHITAIAACQDRLPTDANPLVFAMRPLLQEVEIDFQIHGSRIRTCRVGVSGGEPTFIADYSADAAPLPEQFFTLLPSYPQHNCYQNRLIYNYNVDPPETVGWVSQRVC